jgi:hypothetical protein
MKNCNKCKIDKPLDQFNKCSANRDGKANICKICKRAIDYEYSEKHRDEAAKRARNYYKTNKQKVLDYQKVYGKTDKCREGRKKYREEVLKVHKIDYYRRKKKIDKTVRRTREKNAGKMDVSSLIVLENFNKLNFSSDSFHCEYCSSIIYGMYDLEHIIPLCKEGTNELTNLVISCDSCNRGSGGKHNKLLEHWRPELVDYINLRNIQIYDYKLE